MGATTCATPPTGYVANATNSGIVPENPCATGNGGCDPLVTCTPLPGNVGVTCGPCPSGFTGDSSEACVRIQLPVSTAFFSQAVVTTAGCTASDDVRLRVSYLLRHRKPVPGALLSVSVRRSSDVRRTSLLGGCYGFPASTVANDTRSNTRADQLSPLVTWAESAPSAAANLSLSRADPRTWNDSARCSGPTAVLCRTCTLCTRSECPDSCFYRSGSAVLATTLELPDCTSSATECTQRVHVLTDCFAPTQADLFVNTCPNGGNATAGEVAFDYDVTACWAANETCRPVTSSATIRVRTQLFQLITVPNGGGSGGPVLAPVPALDLEMFDSHTAYWEQNLAARLHPPDGTVFRFSVDSQLVVGVRIDDATLRDQIELQVASLEVCKASLVQAQDLSQSPSLECNDTNSVASFAFWAGGADANACGFENDEACVQYPGKTELGVGQLTSRAATDYMLLCRRESASQFNASTQGDSNQYVGCDGVGLSAETVVQRLGFPRPGQVFVLRASVLTSSMGAHRRRLLAVSGYTEPVAIAYAFTIGEQRGQRIDVVTFGTVEIKAESVPYPLLVSTEILIALIAGLFLSLVGCVVFLTRRRSYRLVSLKDGDDLPVRL